MKKDNKLRVVTILLFMNVLLSCCNNNNATVITQASSSVTKTATESIAIDKTVETFQITPSPIQESEVVSTLATTTNENKRTKYYFDAELDYGTHLFLVKELIHYTNNTNTILAEIPLVVPPNEFSNAFSIISINIGGVNIQNYELNENILRLFFYDPVLKDGKIDIEINYKLQIPNRGGVFGYTGRQTNLSDWYPYVPYYDIEKGWLIHEPSKVGEYLVYDKADFNLNLKYSGAPNLIVSASSLIIPGIDECEIKSENARNITFSISDQYVPLSSSYEGVTVNAFVFQENEDSGWAALKNTANAISFYSKYFGTPYPFETITIVEADFGDGMEYDGLYYMSEDYFSAYDNSLENYLTLISVHETAHQWWYGLIGNDQAMEPWVDEALATYSEYLYLSFYSPELLNWWRAYRIEYYKPTGDVDMTVYDQTDLRTYINAVYLNGALFLDDVRKTLGDEVFAECLREYQNKYINQISTGSNLLEIFISRSPEQINPLIENYFSQK